MHLSLNVEAAASTDIGLVRSSNQDSFGINTDPGLYVICDGMGGVRGGEVASALAVETFLTIACQELASSIPVNDALQRAVAAANRSVIERAAWDTYFRGMGSTLVAAHLNDDQLTLINVGDSRAYLIRDAHATQLTDDHSLVAERVRSGMMTPSEAAVSEHQSVITRAIGAEPDVQPDLFTHTLLPGDTLLLASDGLTRETHPDQLAAILANTPDPAQACTDLIALANHHGGHDNITCIVVRVR